MLTPSSRIIFHSSYFSTLGLINDLRSSKDPISFPIRSFLTPAISTPTSAPTHSCETWLSAEEEANKENLFVLHLNGTVRISRQYRGVLVYPV